MTEIDRCKNSLNKIFERARSIFANNKIKHYLRGNLSDVNLRNEWSNYSNWPYQDVLPTSLFGWDASSCSLIPETSETPIFSTSNPMGWLVTGCRNNANIKGIRIITNV